MNLVQIMGIGERIRQERERLGFTQPVFAALGEASKRSQIAWENEDSYPNAKVLAAWIKVGADIGFIVSGQPSGQVSPEEATLLTYFRAASTEVRRAALGALLGASAPTGLVGGTHSMHSSGDGSIQIGVVHGNARTKNR